MEPSEEQDVQLYTLIQGDGQIKKQQTDYDLMLARQFKDTESGQSVTGIEIIQELLGLEILLPQCY